MQGAYSLPGSAKGAQNYAYGLDGIFRVFGDDYLNVKAAQSYDNEIDKQPGLNGSFIHYAELGKAFRGRICLQSQLFLVG